MKISSKNLFFTIVLITIVIGVQFLFAWKNLQFGFNNDDWYCLAWYKQVVQNPVLDILKGWKEVGSHNFSHVYYIGVLFDFFKFDFLSYRLINLTLKIMADLSLFPVIYLLFKNKNIAFLATIIFAAHYSPFGGILNVIIGEDSLVIICMNLFLALYIKASQDNKFNLKTMIALIFFLVSASFFDITRFYPALLLLPFLEIIRFLLNKSISIKSSILRLFFFYSPFIIVLSFSPQAALSEINFNKFIRIFDWGNYQLILSLFASFGSTFVPPNLYSLFGPAPYNDFGNFVTFLFFRFLVIIYPAIIIICYLVSSNPKHLILKILGLTIFTSFIGYFLTNHYLFIDPKFRNPVDPGLYFLPGLLGLFIFSTAVIFFMEWFKNGRKNNFLLALSFSPILSFLYIFFTWIMADDNSIFTGVHGYLNIAAIASSLYLAILLYLAFQKLNYPRMANKISSILTIIFFLFFLISSYQEVDKYFSFFLDKGGYGASDENKINNSFWKEVGRGQSPDKKPILIYLDGSEDSGNGYFYSGAFVWNVPAMLAIEKGIIFDSNSYCQYMIFQDHLQNMRIQILNGERVIIQNSCGFDLIYKTEKFFAFKMINKDLIPIKSEILKKLEINNY